MKSFVLLTALSAVAFAAPAQMQRRSTWLDIPAMFLSSTPAMQIVDVPSELRNNTIRSKLRFGPFKLDAMNNPKKNGNFRSMDPSGTAYIYLTDASFPKDITILSSGMQSVFRNGTPTTVDADKIYKHHLFLANLSKPPAHYFSCPSLGWFESIMQRYNDQPGFLNIFAGGAEDADKILFTSKDGSFNSGFYVAKNDNIVLQIDVVNGKKVEQDLYVEVDIEYVPGRVPDALDAALQVVGVGFCGGDGQGVNVKPPEGQRKFTLHGKETTAAKDGFILQSRGHLHDGGVSIEMSINGKPACHSQSRYDGPGNTMNGMSTCSEPIPVKKGDTILMTADYDLNEHPPREMHGAGGGHGGDGKMSMEAEEMALMNMFVAYKD